MSERYRRAVRQSPACRAILTPQMPMDGYWLDEERFFFVAESPTPTGDALILTPSVADAGRGVVEALADDRTVLAAVVKAGGRAPWPNAVAARFDYAGGPDLFVDFGTETWRYGLTDKTATRMASKLEPAIWSPDGRYGCVVRGHDLALTDRLDCSERRITFDGAPLEAWGQPPQSGLGILAWRRHPLPVALWSTDSRWLLTHRVDERALPEVVLADSSRPTHGERFRYARLGGPLAIVTPAAIEVATGRILTFDQAQVFAAPFTPLQTRAAWFGGDGAAWLIRTDRHCRSAELLQLDLRTGKSRVVITERSTTYLDLHPIFATTPNARTLQATGEILWWSERDGFGHLYLHDASTGELKRQLTSGAWVVRDVVRVDPRTRSVIFLAAGRDPTADPARRELCRVSLDAGDIEVLAASDGDLSVARDEPAAVDQDRPHAPSYASAGFSPGGHFAVVRDGNVEHGDSVGILNFASGEALPLAGISADRAAPRAEHFSVASADGGSRLHGVIFFPVGFEERGGWPLVDVIYPGPQVAHQPQASSSIRSAQALALAELGIVAIMLDSRGMAVGGRAFRQAGYGRLLEPQLADHAAAVEQLLARWPSLDPRRVGVLGESAGGTAAFRALCDYGGIYRAGVSVCGVHDTERYASYWSDKYGGPRPRTGWPEPSNLEVAHRLAGPVLLVAGELDENVHADQTLALADALRDAGKPFELLIAPGHGHAVLATSGTAQRRVWDFFVRHLLETEPPGGTTPDPTPTAIARMTRRLSRELRR